jgi:hypothetical protein
MYFKGMRKFVNMWDEERVQQKNEEAFNQAFEDIFDDESDIDYSDSESDASSDSSWETSDDLDVSNIESDDEEEKPHQVQEPIYFPVESDVYSNFILDEIKSLQKDYQKAMELGLDFDWYLENFLYFDIEPSKTMYIEDDIFPHFKNLFVSNHKNMVRNKRLGKRNYANTDTAFTTVLVLVF